MNVCMYMCMHIDLLYYCAVMMAGMASSSSLGTFILAHCYLYSFVYTILVSHKLLLKKKIVMRNGQFYHSSRNRASRTAQCREIPHSFPEPFYPVLQVRVGEPTTHPPSQRR